MKAGLEAVMHAAVAEIERPPLTVNGGYWSFSRAPLASLLFVAPLLVVYEAGVLCLGPQAVRNGADIWLRGLLDVLGFGQYFLLPVVTLSLLLAWHHVSGLPWRITWRWLPGMALESACLAVCLVALAHVQGAVCQAIGIPPRETPRVHRATMMESSPPSVREPLLAVQDATPGRAARLVAFLGAGIYEEALFRLMLLPGCAFALVRLGVSRANALAASAVATSLVFALAHYVGPYGEDWQAFSFLFRAAAGAFFAGLFVYRGFGVTAGAHAGYDILVGLS